VGGGGVWRGVGRKRPGFQVSVGSTEDRKMMRKEGEKKKLSKGGGGANARGWKNIDLKRNSVGNLSKG